MLANIRPEDILFLDIETVPAASSFDIQSRGTIGRGCI
jgi:hypothetical protein